MALNRKQVSNPWALEVCISKDPTAADLALWRVCSQTRLFTSSARGTAAAHQTRMGCWPQVGPNPPCISKQIRRHFEQALACTSGVPPSALPGTRDELHELLMLIWTWAFNNSCPGPFSGCKITFQRRAIGSPQKKEPLDVITDKLEMRNLGAKYKFIWLFFFQVPNFSFQMGAYESCLIVSPVSGCWGWRLVKHFVWRLLYF